MRWTIFTIATALVGLTLAFLILFIGRLYGGLLSAEFVFAALVFYSAGVALVAISYAAKIDEEDEADPPLASRNRLDPQRPDPAADA